MTYSHRASSSGDLDSPVTYAVSSRSLVASFVSLALSLLVGTLSACWLAFLMGFALSTPLLLAPSVSLAIAMVYCCRAGASLGRVALAALLVLLLAALSIAAATLKTDLSFDGAAYHSVAVIGLREGWNPLHDPHIATWWATRFPNRAWLADTLWEGGLWIDHYPKAAWVLGALVSLTTGSLGAATWLNAFLLVVAAAAAWRAFRVLGITSALALAAAALAALSPPAIAQSASGMIDGVLASTLVIQLAALMTWSRTRASLDLWVALAACALLANLKFSGLVYGGILLAGFAFTAPLAVWLERRVVLVIGAACIALLSLNPYATNLLSKGNPFYPLGQVALFDDSIAEPDFLARDRLSKLFISLFTEPYDRGVPAVAEPLVPRLWHYERVGRRPAPHRNGFGTLFGWSLFASAASLVAVLAVAWQRGTLALLPTALSVGLAVVAISVLSNPEAWWARFVPQLWLVPILIALMAARLGHRALGWALLAPAALGAALTLALWAKNLIIDQRQANANFASLPPGREVRLEQGAFGDRAVFTAAHEFAQRGVTVRLVPPGACAPTLRFLFVEICRADVPGDAARSMLR